MDEMNQTVVEVGRVSQVKLVDSQVQYNTKQYGSEDEGSEEEIEHPEPEDEIPVHDDTDPRYQTTDDIPSLVASVKTRGTKTARSEDRMKT